MATIKNDLFCEEREWRVIASAMSDSTHFRVGPLGVTPFLELDLPQDSIEEVVLGPGRYPEVRAAGVRELLREHGIFANVRESSAPFRV